MCRSPFSWLVGMDRQLITGRKPPTEFRPVTPITAGRKLGESATLYQPEKCAAVLRFRIWRSGNTLASGRSRGRCRQSGDIPTYADRLRDVIQKTRQDFGGRNVPWMVARASFNGRKQRQRWSTQQENVIATSGFNVFQGPYNDTIQNRNAGQHRRTLSQ